MTPPIRSVLSKRPHASPFELCETVPLAANRYLPAGTASSAKSTSVALVTDTDGAL